MNDLLSDERRASVASQLRALMYQHAHSQREPNISGLCAVAANELEALGNRLKALEDFVGRIAAAPHSSVATRFKAEAESLLHGRSRA